MLRDRSSLCTQILLTRASHRFIGMLVSAIGLFCGCASPSMSTANLPTAFTRQSAESTFRSQDTPLKDDWLSPSNSAAKNSLPANPRSSPGLWNSGKPSSVRAAAPGHSFAQPKARLGRPITDTRSIQNPPNAGPTAGHSLNVTTSSPTDPWAPSKTAQQNSAFPKHNAWQSVRQPNETQTAEILSRKAPLMGDAHTLSGQPVGEGTQGIQPPLKSDPVSVSDSMAETDPADITGSTSEVPAPDATITDPAADTDPASELPSTEGPTMLDRLRGLYNPRLDENADKLKKQIRRWPDPFGLLTDRDDAAALTPETPETEAGAESLKSAEAAAVPLLPQPTPGTSTSVQTAITELERQLTEWPRLPSGKPAQPTEWRQRQTDLRLLHMIAGRSAESIRIIESLPEEEQEYWQSLMLSMNRFRQGGEDSDRPEQLTESLQHLRNATKKLRPLAQLTIPRIILCDRIDGFGSVAEFPTANFEPGQRILVYTELQNFRSELTAAGRYRSEFAAVLEFLREGEDEVVDTIRVPQIEDLCDVERTDYFQSFELTLPALEGKYLMRLRLRDQLSLQTAVAELEFTVQSRN